MTSNSNANDYVGNCGPISISQQTGQDVKCRAMVRKSEDSCKSRSDVAEDAMSAKDRDSTTPNGLDQSSDPIDTEKTTFASPLELESQAGDHYIVDWNGPNDQANPLNWLGKSIDTNDLKYQLIVAHIRSNWKKTVNIVLISAMTFLTPLASSMFAPGVPEVMREFNSDSPLLATFVVSVYVLGWALGPLVCRDGYINLVHANNPRSSHR